MQSLEHSFGELGGGFNNSVSVVALRTWPGFSCCIVHLAFINGVFNSMHGGCWVMVARGLMLLRGLVLLRGLMLRRSLMVVCSLMLLAAGCHVAA